MFDYKTLYSPKKEERYEDYTRYNHRILKAYVNYMTNMLYVVTESKYGYCLGYNYDIRSGYYHDYAYYKNISEIEKQLKAQTNNCIRECRLWNRV